MYSITDKKWGKKAFILPTLIFSHTMYYVLYIQYKACIYKTYTQAFTRTHVISNVDIFTATPWCHHCISGSPGGPFPLSSLQHLGLFNKEASGSSEQQNRKMESEHSILPELSQGLCAYSDKKNREEIYGLFKDCCIMLKYVFPKQDLNFTCP